MSGAKRRAYRAAWMRRWRKENPEKHRLAVRKSLEKRVSERPEILHLIRVRAIERASAWSRSHRHRRREIVRASYAKDIARSRQRCRRAAWARAGMDGEAMDLMELLYQFKRRLRGTAE